MLSGTPLDLTPLAGMLEVMSALYWVIAIVLALLALRLPAHWVLKAAVSASILAAFVVPAWRQARDVQERQDRYQARLAAATALFQERCKLSGEKIRKTVPDVEGVVWMKWRPGNRNDGDQFTRDDPYGSDCGGEECILQLLRVTKGVDRDPRAAMQHRGRYRYVESVDPVDSRLYRYTGAIQSIKRRTPEQIEAYKRNSNGLDPGPDVWGLGLDRVPIERSSARYGITWDDISTREDREHWIAGGSLKVVDLQTDEVIAERVGFMMDRGLGSKAGFRSPWGYAVQTACPEFPHEPTDSRRGRTLHETRTFVSKVLMPTQEE